MEKNLFDLFFNLDNIDKENMPKTYKVIKTEKGINIIYNALGIKKEDLKINLINNYNRKILTIKGETKDNVANKIYKIGADIEIRMPLEQIEWRVENGLLYIFLTEKKEKIDIKIKNIN